MDNVIVRFFILTYLIIFIKYFDKFILRNSKVSNYLNLDSICFSPFNYKMYLSYNKYNMPSKSFFLFLSSCYLKMLILSNIHQIRPMMMLFLMQKCIIENLVVNEPTTSYIHISQLYTTL